MNIYVARHGQTDLNRQGCWQGRIDMELNDTGRAQAEEIAKIKMPDLNAATLEAATEMIKGTARSMGIVIED